jgi:hypothetical protein
VHILRRNHSLQMLYRRVLLAITAADNNKYSSSRNLK